MRRAPSLVLASLWLACSASQQGAIAPPPRPSPRPPAPAVAAPTPSPPSTGAPDVEALLGRMTLEQKVGQLLMVGFSGTAIDAKITELVKGLQVGGVCLFKRNLESAEQAAALNDALRALLADALPPFITVDQEGGNVVRVSDRVAVLPGNMAVGATRSKELAREGARAQAEDLRRLGFNMNLAPVLDVNENPLNPVIGIRSFGDRPALVAELGAASVQGQQEANVATIAKHFPGHGSVESDSHKGLPVLKDTAAQMEEHFLPFKAAMALGLDGVMTAHVAVPSLSGDEVPATLSGAVLTTVLRERLGFDGLVLTDELEMQAIEGRYGVGRAAVLAVQAGADMVLIPWRPEKKLEVHAALLEAAKSGALSPARLDASVRRILKLKVKRGLFTPLPPLAERLKELGKDRAVMSRIAREAVTLVRNDRGVLPVAHGARVLVVTAEEQLLTAIRVRVPQAAGLVVPAFPAAGRREGDKRAARALADRADVVVVGLLNANQLELVNVLALSGKPLVVVSMGLPYLAARVPLAQGVLAVYSYRETAAEAAAAALFGEAPTPGRLPVSLPRLPFGFGLRLQPGGAGTTAQPGAR